MINITNHGNDEKIRNVKPRSQSVTHAVKKFQFDYKHGSDN